MTHARCHNHDIIITLPQALIAAGCTFSENDVMPLHVFKQALTHDSCNYVEGHIVCVKMIRLFAIPP